MTTNDGGGGQDARVDPSNVSVKFLFHFSSLTLKGGNWKCKNAENKLVSSLKGSLLLISISPTVLKSLSGCLCFYIGFPVLHSLQVFLLSSISVVSIHLCRLEFAFGL